MKPGAGTAAFATAFALATSAAGAEPAASPDELAKARALADRVVADAHAADVFENATQGKVVEVRHRASGLVCSFDPDDGGASVHIYESAGLPRGDDISCSHHVVGACSPSTSRATPSR